MPHLTIEYSENLRERTDMLTLCRALAQALAEQRADGNPVYPLGGIRVRAYPAEDYCIANGEVLGAGFVHATLKIGAGRSEAVRRATGDALFDAMKRHFARLYESSGLALSLDIIEFAEAGTWKHNNLHDRLRQRG